MGVKMLTMSKPQPR